ncbi:MAG: lipopolysaccharide biosynthesis protein [Firmicutes bacterium]|nr:lipopolysaccharide biosynthesis protein [Bacillota bacterium]
MDEQTIDLKQVIKTIRKRKRTIIQTFLATVIIVAAISFLLPPTYEGEATLRIKQPKGLADSLLGDTPLGNTGATKQQMSTYAEILKSRTVVQSVIDQTMAGKEDIPTYEDMLKHITTQPVKDTEILNIKVKADSPEEARNITNTLVNTFIERLTGLVRSEQSTVREFIGERMRDAKADLAKAEDNLERYKKNEKIVAPEDETKAMIDKLSTLDKLSAENAVAMTANQARLASARKELADENPGFVADNPLIQQYKGKLAELEVQLATLSRDERCRRSKKCHYYYSGKK